MNQDLFENLFQEEVYALPPVSTVIYLPKPWSQLTDDEVTLLSRILASVKLNLASVRIQVQAVIDFESIHDTTRLLIFGSKTIPETRPYELVRRGDLSIIWSDPLHLLDDAKKKSLWGALKQLFANG